QLFLERFVRDNTPRSAITDPAVAPLLRGIPAGMEPAPIPLRSFRGHRRPGPMPPKAPPTPLQSVGRRQSAPPRAQPATRSGDGTGLRFRPACGTPVGLADSAKPLLANRPVIPLPSTLVRVNSFFSRLLGTTGQEAVTHRHAAPVSYAAGTNPWSLA